MSRDQRAWWGFCPTCERDTAQWEVRELVNLSLDGVVLGVMDHYNCCQVCGQAYTASWHDDSLARAYALYQEMTGKSYPESRRHGPVI